MEIIVVTGLRKNREAIDKCVADLINSGYRWVRNPAAYDLHPSDIVADTNALVEFIGKYLSVKKFVIETNSDHVINALRVLKHKNVIRTFNVIHFGEDGVEKLIKCQNDGEMSEYPDGFLDMWPKLMSQLA